MPIHINDFPLELVLRIAFYLDDKSLSEFANTTKRHWQITRIDRLLRDSKQAVNWQTALFRTLLLPANVQNPLWKSFDNEEMKARILFFYQTLKSQPRSNPRLLSLANDYWQQSPVYFSDLPAKKHTQNHEAQFISAMSLFDPFTRMNALYGLLGKDVAAQQKLADEIAERIISSTGEGDITNELLTLSGSELAVQVMLNRLEETESEGVQLSETQREHKIGSIMMWFPILFNSHDEEIHIAAQKILKDIASGIGKIEVDWIVPWLLKKLDSLENGYMAQTILNAMISYLPMPHVEKIARNCLGISNSPYDRMRDLWASVLGITMSRLVNTPMHSVVLNELWVKLKDPNKYARAGACYALQCMAGHLADAQHEVMHKLLAAINDVEQNVWVNACRALGTVVKHLPAVSDDIIDLLLEKINATATDPVIPKLVCNTLSSMNGYLKDEQINKIVLVFLAKLDDSNVPLCAAAWNALGAMAGRLTSEQMDKVALVLLARLNDPNKLRYEFTSKVLAIIVDRLTCEQIDKVILTLLAKVKVSNQDIRKVAWTYLGMLTNHLKDKQIDDVIDVFMTVLNGYNFEIKRIASGIVSTMMARMSEEKFNILVAKAREILNVFDYNAPLPENFFYVLDCIAIRLNGEQVTEFVLVLLVQLNNPAAVNSYKIIYSILDNMKNYQLDTQIIAVTNALLNGLFSPFHEVCTAAYKVLYDLPNRMTDKQFMETATLFLAQITNIRGTVWLSFCNILSVMINRLTEELRNEFVEELLGALTEADKLMRARACNTLGIIVNHLTEPQIELVTEGLLRVLSSSDGEVHVEAYNALRLLGQYHPHKQKLILEKLPSIPKFIDSISFASCQPQILDRLKPEPAPLPLTLDQPAPGV